MDFSKLFINSDDIITSATTACKMSCCSLEQYLIAFTFGCVIIAFNASFTWFIFTKVSGPSNSASSAALLQISSARLASPDTDATFL